jgi:hypothetical protein
MNLGKLKVVKDRKYTQIESPFNSSYNKKLIDSFSLENSFDK